MKRWACEVVVDCLGSWLLWVELMQIEFDEG
jgi:hypothetical protein